MERNRVRSLIARAKTNAAQLDAGSLCRAAATSEWFAELTQAHPPEREMTYLPTLLLHLGRRSVEQLRAFDADVELVRNAAPDPSRVGAFIGRSARSSKGDTRQWVAECAELAVLAALIDYFGSERVRIEPALPNGKVTDAAVFVVDRWVWIEVTALNTSDAEYEAERVFRSVRVGYGDPYHHARRWYRKAFDKIIGTQSDPRSQLHPSEPSVLVIVDGATGVESDSPGMEWALSQILVPDARTVGDGASLRGWLNNDYPDNPDEAIRSIRHLSAVGVLDYGFGLRSFTPNTEPDENHALTADEFAILEGVLSIQRPWSSEPANP